MNSFGENLKKARTDKGISQGNLAEMMEIHPTHISRYERNLTTPSIEVVKKFADILEVSTDTLVYGSQEEKAKSKITDSELLSMFIKTQNLAPKDIETVKRFLKAFIFQKDMQKQLA